jgi:hypothetical protein
MLQIAVTVRRSLGIAPREVDAALHRLLRARRIRRVSYSGKTFYEPA